MSFGEAMTSFLGYKMDPANFNDRFALFYNGPRKSAETWFLYGEFKEYEHPTLLHLDLDDSVS